QRRHRADAGHSHASHARERRGLMWGSVCRDGSDQAGRTGRAQPVAVLRVSPTGARCAASEPPAAGAAAPHQASSLQSVPAAIVPFPPMEAELVRELPSGDGWQYEPKWDGFRGVLENAGGELALWSRKERPLLRYFPELRPLGELLPPRSAL